MRVLIIDDDRTFCELLAETLEEKGIEVEWTTDGFGGYEMSLDQPYDLFILDQRMPSGVGKRTCRISEGGQSRSEDHFDFGLR